MSWFTKLIGGSAAEPIKVLGDVADELFTSDDERLSHAEVMERIKNEPRLGQILTNQIEAKHSSIFVAGWRPAIGWVCAGALFNWFLVNPWIQWLTCIFGTACIKGPDIDIAGIIGLVSSMLGVAYLRTREKEANVQDSH